jgi:hypothetical protein
LGDFEMIIPANDILSIQTNEEEFIQPIQFHEIMNNNAQIVLNKFNLIIINFQK